jgi:D-sedoheptulose 7-phosphate isomerase
MLEQRIQQQFFDSADLKYAAADTLTRPITDAVNAILGCITSGGKVLACGNGGSAGQAQHFAAQFIGRFERERPPLAAIALSADSALLTTMGSDANFEQVYARQVQAIGHPGDVLLAICPDGTATNVLAAIEAAHDKEMAVIALTGQDGRAVGRSLSETDVRIGVPHQRVARIQEVHLLVIHCLCDAVDLQLLGDH